MMRIVQFTASATAVLVVLYTIAVDQFTYTFETLQSVKIHLFSFLEMEVFFNSEEWVQFLWPAFLAQQTLHAAGYRSIAELYKHLNLISGLFFSTNTKHSHTLATM